MPYNEELDSRIGQAIAGWKTTRKKMFGGTCHILNGHMLCGVYKDFLVLRLGDDAGTQALEAPYVRCFDITGRPMAGWVMVEAPGYQGDALERWLAKARAYVETLPAK